MRICCQTTVDIQVIMGECKVHIMLPPLVKFFSQNSTYSLKIQIEAYGLSLKKEFPYL